MNSSFRCIGRICESFLPQLSRAEILETQKKIPTAIAIMTGQRSKPVPIELIQAQVQASQQRNLGVAFFYYETLWDRASESARDTQIRLSTTVCRTGDLVPPEAFGACHTRSGVIRGETRKGSTGSCGFP